jgi:gliding motility-associated-like protein
MMQWRFNHIKCFTIFAAAMLLFVCSNAQEICNNGIDDDNNGLADLHDPACQCRFNVTGNLLLNGSFESYNRCPVSYLYSEEKNIADHWQYGTYTNVNEANFYHNFSCQLDSERIMLYMPPLRPLPDGDAFISITKKAYADPVFPENEMNKSYVGQCLQAPLKKGEDYILSFYGGRFRSWDDRFDKLFPFDVAVFGSADCNAVPFGKVNAFGNGCPANYPGWILLGSTTVVSQGQWVQTKIRLNIPTDINTIVIGPDCNKLIPVIEFVDSTTFLDYYQYYLDDMHLLPAREFPFQYIHLQATSICTDHLVLAAPGGKSIAYQWYKDSIAIAGATDSLYHVLDNDKTNYYNVSIITDTGCIISEPFLVTAAKLGSLHITADTLLCEENPMLQLAPAIEGVTYRINGQPASVVSIDKEGIYTIIAQDVRGCEKTFTTVVSKIKCSACAASIPKAFTPNGDGRNDLFRPIFKCSVSAVQLIIFNKWGQKIFESKDAVKGWDGTWLGNNLNSGTYVYYLQYKTIDNISRNMKGAVVLLR